jgi:hypothetical protein
MVNAKEIIEGKKRQKRTRRKSNRCAHISGWAWNSSALFCDDDGAHFDQASP